MKVEVDKDDIERLIYLCYKVDWTVKMNYRHYYERIQSVMDKLRN